MVQTDLKLDPWGPVTSSDRLQSRSIVVTRCDLMGAWDRRQGQGRI